VSCRDDIEVVGRAIVLVVLGTSQEFLVMHDLEICSLNGVVGIKGIGNPMFAIVVSTLSYLHFISYAVTLASFFMIGLDWRRLSSCIVAWVWSGVSLDVGSVGCVVNGIAPTLARVFARALAAGLAGVLAAALAAGLTGYATSFSPRLSSATGSRGPWLRRRW
jgi:hypothetical protein